MAILLGKKNTIYILWEMEFILMQKCFTVSPNNMIAVEPLRSLGDWCKGFFCDKKN